MRTLSTLSIIAVFLLTAHCAFQKKQEQTQPKPATTLEPTTFSGDYADEWRIIDSLERQGLYKSALESTERLQARAKKEKKTPQVIKTLLFRGKYTTMLEEDGFVKAVRQFEEEASGAPALEKAVFESMLGQLYATYLSNQGWRLGERTPIPEGEGGDILTWSAEQIERRALTYYQSSLKPVDLLRQTPAEYLRDITQSGQGDTATAPLRPTLYELLAFRALEHFSNERSYLTEPAYKFYIDQPAAFAPATEFANTPFPSQDSTSGKWLAINLFRELTAAHLKDKDPSALLDIELQRLQFTYNNAVLAEKDSLYERALQNLHGRYEQHVSDAEILHHLATLYLQQSEEKPEMLKRVVALCEDAIRRHPGSFGARQCAALLAQVQTPSLQISTELAYLPDRPMLALIGYKNLNKVWLKAIRIPQDPEQWSRIPWNERVAFFNRQAAAWQQTIELPDPGDYAAHRTEFKMDPLPAGNWIVVVSDNPAFDIKAGFVASANFSVSNLAAITHTEEGVANIWSVDRATGAPRPGVKAELFFNQWDRKQGRNEWLFLRAQESGSDGRIRLSGLNEGQSVSVRLSHGADTIWLNGQFNNYTPYKGDGRRTAQFFTDRSMYRPGQTVYFKAVLMNVDQKGMPTIAPNTDITVQLYDANGQPKNKLELRSNAFGTVNGAFAAPSSGLTGMMSVLAEGWDGGASFNVEEYKRPRFEIAFKPVEGAFRLDEEVTMRASAKNYAGSVVDGAQVRYRVVRTARFPFWDFWSWRKPFPWRQEEMEIANGVTTTDAEGNFNVTFTALPDRSIPVKDQPLFDFTVYADVTDISGETRSNLQTLSIGYAALQVQIPEGSTIHLDSLARYEIKTSNLAGQFQAATGKVTLQRLVAPKVLYNKRYWETPDQWLLKESDFKRDFPEYAWKEADNPKNWGREDFTSDIPFNTGQNKVLNLQTGTIRPGYYLLTLETADAYGVPVKLERVIAVWSDRERQWLFDTPAMIPEKTTYEPGVTARLWLGSPVAGLQFLVGTERNGRFEQLRWQKTDGGSAYEIPILESDRGGLSAHAQAIWNNRLYEIGSQYLNVPWSNKELNIQFESFRDKLAPGQKEEWRLRISGPAKEKVAAEMVAAMYDASLDQFLPHGWAGIGFPMHYAQIGWRNAGLFGEQSGIVQNEKPGQYETGASRSYQQIDWFGFPLYGGRYYGMMRQRNGAEKMMMADEVAVMAAPAAAANMAKDSAGEDIRFDIGSGAPPSTPTPAEAPPSPIRTNLNETVFFFPTLTTDAEGNVILKFTMNEALTRWKLLTFTHTKTLQNAIATKEVVTQKDLMVIANPPRFLRAGDEIEFAAKVSNLTDKALTGTATLALLDAATLQPVESGFGLTLQNKKVNFTAPAGQSAPLAWKVRIPADYTGAVTWQVFAECPSARDGEESTIPVVTNRMLVTETMPITVRGGQSKTFVFDEAGKKESATRKNHRYTLEFTSNPAWYAVQSLPYLMEFPHECNEQIFNRLYSNTLAQHVTQKQPAIRRVYERWKASGALKSNLNKNQELKSALLEETPWVLDAQSEEQQQQNIALLFDLNRMADERERALNALAERQSGDGGWPWFPGGRDSWYVTQYILSGFGHLQQLGALDQQNDPQTGEMIEKALRFCQEEAERNFMDIEKEVKAGRTTWEADHLDGMIIHYLYTRSFFTVDRTDKITAYYIEQAEKYWLGKGLYQEGLLALALHRHGRTDAATKIVNSLRERALVKEELGMYWVFDWGYYWYQLPVETQALMVEVFDEVAQDRTAVENLRIWLLKNKQTNRWESTKATSEAVYALLLRGDNWLNNTKTVQVTMGTKTLQPKEVEAGTGYFKQSWTGAEVKSDWNKLKVDNPNSSIVWGAAYWQYFEDLDKITSFKKTPLTVVKTLYREENSPTGPKLVALQSGDGLKVGDKVKVRIELRVDRPMEFVHLKDMRAAGFEPVNVLSNYRWQDGLGYYESTKDLATHFFIDYLPRGTFVLEYMLIVSHKGDMSNGVTTLQCMYAPEFSSHSEGVRIRVD